MHGPAVLLLRFVVVFLAIYAFAAGQILLQLRRRVIRQETTSYTGIDDIPPEQRHILDLPRPWLEAQGFQFMAWQLDTDMINLPGAAIRAKPKALYLDQSGTVRCKVSVALPHHGVTYSLSFSTTLADGSEICTLNRAGLVPAPADYQLADEYLPTDAAQLALHCQRIAGLPAVVLRDYDAVLARINQLHERMFGHWLEQGMITARNNSWHLSWSGTFRLYRLVHAYNRRLKKSPPPVGVASSAAAVAHSEKQMLRQQLAAARPQAASSGRKAWVFVATVVVFLALARIGFGGGWTFVAALTVVLLFHELGHFLAMKLFGYRDLSIFFLPLLGAAASGRKDNAPPWQQLVIFLAGPAPGLLLAISLLASPTLAALLRGQLAQFTVYALGIAVFVNYINLLPVMPLDGGRVVELLFFARLPRASFIFFILCAAALALAAAFTHDGVLWVLAAVLTLNLPFQRKLMLISQVLRPYYGRCRNQRQALDLLAEALARHGQQWQTFTRVNISKALLPRLRSGLPGWKTVALGALVYFGLLLAPVVALLNLNDNMPATGPAISHLLPRDPLAQADAPPLLSPRAGQLPTLSPVMAAGSVSPANDPGPESASAF